jgi:hypothetical protein
MWAKEDKLHNAILDLLETYGEMHQDMIVKKCWYELGLKRYKAESITRRLRQMASEGAISRDGRGNYWR